MALKAATKRIMLWALLPTIAQGLSLLFIIFVYAKGPHSTLGIWTGVFSLPGLAVGAWISFLTGWDYLSYVSVVLVNWLFWFGVLKLFSFLRSKFRLSS